MVANITTGKSILGALIYNQLKVDKGKASVLATSLIRERSDGKFDAVQTAEEILAWMPSCIRTEKPVVHISLNPDPKDVIDDDQLAEIAHEYLEGMGWSEQPYIVYKHTDIERTHIHIVTIQVNANGRKINDSRRNKRSVAITERLERKYHLHPAKGQKRVSLWQLKPVDYKKGDLKDQIAAVVKPALAMYRFQTMGELRALLSLYRIGIEEVQGVRAGKPFRGLVYVALDEKGEKAPVSPLKASRLGDDASLKKIETILTSSSEKIKSANLHKMTLHHVEEALIEASSEEELRKRLKTHHIDLLRKRLKTHHIDLFLRRNAQNRITGVTFIDHENRCVLNGSRLGKEYSANAFNERFSAVKETRETSRQVKKESNIKLKNR